MRFNLTKYLVMALLGVATIGLVVHEITTDGTQYSSLEVSTQG